MINRWQAPHFCSSRGSPIHCSASIALAPACPVFDNSDARAAIAGFRSPFTTRSVSTLQKRRFCPHVLLSALESKDRSNSQSDENTSNASGGRFGFTMIFVVPDKALAHRMPVRQSRFNQRIPKQHEISMSIRRLVAAYRHDPNPRYRYCFH